VQRKSKNKQTGGGGVAENLGRLRKAIGLGKPGFRVCHGQWAAGGPWSSSHR
jgi:hypothetical protein